MLSKENARSASRPSKKLFSPGESKEIARYMTPQRKHENSPIVRYRKPKVTRVVEGHLMPIRDTSMGPDNKGREGFIEHELLMRKEIGEDFWSPDFRLTAINRKSW